jgi:FkbM family methyltransferase
MRQIHFITPILIIVIILFMLCKNYNVINIKRAGFWDDILHVSNEQELIDKKVLFKTINFMLTETEEDDPKLIRFVQSLIKYESKTSANLTDKNRKDFSRFGQSTYIDTVLKSKRNGFFIEAGVFNGEDYSNSLFFELERDWTGLLIEPIPSLYKQILSKNRKAFTINCCIANNRPFVRKFQLDNVLSSKMDQGLEAKNKKIIYIPCFSLSTILKAINVNKVDYFSLDVEGAELEVLKSTNLNKLDITTFSVEHNKSHETKIEIKNFLEANNYMILKESNNSDSYFIKK